MPDAQLHPMATAANSGPDTLKPVDAEMTETQTRMLSARTSEPGAQERLGLSGMDWFSNMRALALDRWNQFAADPMHTLVQQDDPEAAAFERQVLEDHLSEIESRRRALAGALERANAVNSSTIDPAMAQALYMDIVQADPRFGFKDYDGTKLFGDEAGTGNDNLRRLLAVYNGVSPDGLFSRDAQMWLHSEQTEKLAAAKQQRSIGRAALQMFDSDQEIVDYHEEQLMQKQDAVRFASLMSTISPRAQTWVLEGLANGELDEKAAVLLNNDELEAAAAAFQTMTPYADANWWLTQGLSQAWDVTKGVVAGTWRTLAEVWRQADGIGSYGGTDKGYEEKQRRQLTVENAMRTKLDADRLTFGGKMLAGLIGTTPYMAAMSNPVTGSMAAMGMMNDARERMVLEGIDPEEALIISVPVGAVETWIEKLQMEKLAGKEMTHLQLRQIAITRLVDHFKKGGVRAVGRTLLKEGKEGLVVWMTENTEEVLQQLTEDIGVQIAKEEFNVRELMESGYETFIESAPTTLGFGIIRGTGIGPAVHRKLSPQINVADAAEYFQRKNVQVNVLADMAAKKEGELVKPEPKAEAVPGDAQSGDGDAQTAAQPQTETAAQSPAQAEGETAQPPAQAEGASQTQEGAQPEETQAEEAKTETPKADTGRPLLLARAERRLDEIRRKWHAGRTTGARYRALIDEGLQPDQAAAMNEFFELEDAFAAGNPYFEEVTGLAGISDTRQRISALERVAKAHGESIRYKRTKDGYHVEWDINGKTVHLKVKWQSREEMLSADRERLTDQLRAQYDERHGAGAWDAQVAANPEFADIQLGNAQVNALFTAIQIEEEGITYDGILALARPGEETGGIDAFMSEEARVGHELFHAATLIAQRAGIISEAEIAKLREVFGEGKSEGEAFDEEAAADKYGDFIYGKTDGISEYDDIFTKIRDFFRGIYERLFGAAQLPAVGTELSEENIFELIRRGDIKGIGALDGVPVRKHTEAEPVRAKPQGPTQRIRLLDDDTIETEAVEVDPNDLTVAGEDGYDSAFAKYEAELERAEERARAQRLQAMEAVAAAEHRARERALLDAFAAEDATLEALGKEAAADEAAAEKVRQKAARDLDIRTKKRQKASADWGKFYREEVAVVPVGDNGARDLPNSVKKREAELLREWRAARYAERAALERAARAGVPGAPEAWCKLNIQEKFNGELRAARKALAAELAAIDTFRVTADWSNSGLTHVLGRFTLESKSAFIKRRMQQYGETKAQAEAKTDGLYPENGFSAPWINKELYGDGKGGTSPDAVAQSLYDEGLIPEPTADAMWDAIRADVESVQTERERAKDYALSDWHASFEAANAERRRNLASVAEMDADGPVSRYSARRRLVNEAQMDLFSDWLPEAEARRQAALAAIQGRGPTPEERKAARDLIKDSGSYVSNDAFRKTFGFWTVRAQGSGIERDIYEEMLYIAETLDIPYTAMSLGGAIDNLKLGNLRGQKRGEFGWKREWVAEGQWRALRSIGVEYRPSQEMGHQSTFAHEWLHALDNILSFGEDMPISFPTMREATGGFVSDSAAQFGAPEEAGIFARREIWDAYTQLLEAIRGSGWYAGMRGAIRRGKKYYFQPTEMISRLFQSWLYYQRHSEADLVSPGTGKTWFGITSEGGYAYPLKKDVEALEPALKNLFDALKVKESSATGMKTVYSARLGEPLIGAGGQVITGREIVEAARARGLTSIPAQRLRAMVADDPGNAAKRLLDGLSQYAIPETDLLRVAESGEADLEYAEIEAQYRGTDQWMKAPNGQPTNLTERQWIQVRTLSFKAWFGDWENDPENASKVVDENGEPLVVYRGNLDRENPNVFRFGKKIVPYTTLRNFFTTSREVAESFSYGEVQSVFLDIKNPGEFDAKGHSYNDLGFDGGSFSSVDRVDELLDGSHDGVRLSNIDEHFTGIIADDWVVNWKNEEMAQRQIKSATDNVGTFSRESNDIRYSVTLSDVNAYADGHNLSEEDRKAITRYAVEARTFSDETRALWARALTHTHPDDIGAALATPEAGAGKYPTISRVIAENFKRPMQFSAKVKGLRIRSSEDVAAMMMAVRSPFQEMMKVVYLDEKSRVLDARILTIGISTQALVETQSLLTDAPDGTISVILSHNHPTGNVTPSRQDRETTKHIMRAVKFAGLELRDHIITNGIKYYSLKDDREYHLPANKQSNADWEITPLRSKRFDRAREVAETAEFLRQDGTKAAVFYFDNSLQLVGARLLPKEVFGAAYSQTERYRAIHSYTGIGLARSAVVCAPFAVSAKVIQNIYDGFEVSGTTLLDVVELVDPNASGGANYRSSRSPRIWPLSVSGAVNAQWDDMLLDKQPWTRYSITSDAERLPDGPVKDFLMANPYPEYSQSGGLYPRGKKPSREAYENGLDSWFVPGDRRAKIIDKWESPVKLVRSYALDEWNGKEWVRIDEQPLKPLSEAGPSTAAYYSSIDPFEGIEEGSVEYANSTALQDTQSELDDWADAMSNKQVYVGSRFGGGRYYNASYEDRGISLNALSDIGSGKIPLHTAYRLFGIENKKKNAEHMLFVDKIMMGMKYPEQGSSDPRDPIMVKRAYEQYEKRVEKERRAALKKQNIGRTARLRVREYQKSGSRFRLVSENIYEGEVIDATPTMVTIQSPEGVFRGKDFVFTSPPKEFTPSEVASPEFDALGKFDILWHHVGKGAKEMAFATKRLDEITPVEIFAIQNFTQQSDEVLNKVLDITRDSDLSYEEAKGQIAELFKKENPVVEPLKTARIKEGIRNLVAGVTTLTASSRYSARLREMDAAYMDAVNRGDMETAQRMVREAAAMAMPNTKVVDKDGLPMVVYRGREGRTTVLDTMEDGLHFSTDALTARVFGEGDELKSDGNTIKVFLDVRNPLDLRKAIDESASLDEFKAALVELGVDLDAPYNSPYASEGQTIGSAIDSIGDIESLRDDPNAGLTDFLGGSVKDKFDAIITWEGSSRNEFDVIVFSPNQIKSADTATYDDNGNLIPLSQRFNPERNDIRYSAHLRETDYTKLPASLATVTSPTTISALTHGGHRDERRHDRSYAEGLLASDDPNEVAKGEYILAKLHGDADAAVRIISRVWLKNGKLPESRRAKLRDLQSKLDPARPIVFIPLLNEEGSDLNQLPLAYATFLLQSFGGEVNMSIRKTSRGANTNASGVERATREIVFRDDAEIPSGAQVVIVDDVYTSGHTVAALMAHLREHGVDTVAVTTLATSRYGNGFAPGEKVLLSAQKKSTLTSEELRKEIGYGYENFTGAELQAYTFLAAVKPGRDGAIEYFGQRVPGRGRDIRPDGAVNQQVDSGAQRGREAVGGVARQGVQAPATRASIKLADINRVDMVTAVAANRRRAGKAVDEKAVAEMLRQVNEDPAQARDVLFNAEAIVYDAREKLRSAISDKAVSDPQFLRLATDAAKRRRILAMSERVGKAAYRMGVEDERRAQELAQAKDQVARDAIEGAEGYTADAMESKYGFDIVGTVANSMRAHKEKLIKPEDPEDKPGQVNGPGKPFDPEEEKEAELPEPEEVDAPESAFMASINAAAAQRADAIDAKYNLVGGTSPEQQRENEDIRLENEHNAQRAEEEETEKPEPEEPEADAGEAVDVEPEPIIKRERLDFKRASDFIAFIETVVEKELRDDGKVRDGEGAFDSPVNLRMLVNTSRRWLRKIAEELCASAGREHIMNAIRQMDKATTLDAAECAAMNIYARIQERLITQSQKELVKMLEKKGKKLAEKGKRFSHGGDERDRKVRTEVEYWWRNIKRYFRMSPEAIQAELEALEQILDEREKVVETDESYNLHNDLQWQRAMDLKAALSQYGGLIRMRPAQIEAIANDILEQLQGSRDELINAREDRRIEMQIISTRLQRAMTNPIAQRDNKRPEPDWATRMFDSMMGILEVRLRNLIRFSSGKVRTEAEADIQNVEDAIALASQGYHAYLVRQKDAFGQMLTALYGSSTEGMRRLTEVLDDADRARISKQGVSEMTRAWLMQRYVELLQTEDYGTNIALHKRDGEWRKAFDEVFNKYISTEDMKLISWFRDWYRSNLDEINEKVLLPISGIKQYSPGENYFPVKMYQKERMGYGAKAKTWSPYPNWLAPRVRHSLDFDERTNIIDLWYDRMKTGGASIHYAKLGVNLSDIFMRPDMKKVIRENHGDQALQRLTEHLMDIASGGGREIKSSDDSLAFADKLRGWQTNLTLSANFGSAFKQMLSCPVFALRHDISLGMVMKFMTDIDAGAIRDMISSDGWVARYGNGYSEAIQNAMALNASGQRNAMANIVKSIYNAGFKVMEIGDAVPCLWCGQGLYRYFVKKLRDEAGNNATMTEQEIREKAMTRTWAIIEMTQQSKRVENLTAAQRGGPLGRLLYQFMSSPLQQLSYEVQVIREAYGQAKANGGWAHVRPETKAHLYRTLVINHIIMPNLMNAAAILVGLPLGAIPDRDDLINNILISTLIGQFGCIFMAGAVGESTFRALISGKYDYRDHGLPVTGIVDLFEKLGVTAHDLLTLNVDDLKDDILGIIQSTSAPGRQAVKAYRNYVEGANKRNIESWTED